MMSETLNDILNLLAVTVFADKRVFAKEIETFLKVTKKLKHLPNALEGLSEARLLAWFDENSDLIRNRLESPDFESWLYGCLNRLTDFDHKPVILDLMLEIAKSDGEFHVSEQALIVLTANHWDIALVA